MSVFLSKRCGARTPGPLLSLNDHRWGNQPGDERKAQDGRKNGGGSGGGNDGDGPPDLDQLWRDFNARLNRLFGRRGDGPYRPNARGLGVSAVVVAGIAALIWLASGAFVVQDGQVGVVSTFGRFSHVTDAGFNWRWPAPIQTTTIVDTARVQNAEIGYRNNVRNKQPAEALMLTGDENLVDVQFTVQYKIRNPVDWTFNNGDQVGTLRDAAEAVMRQNVGRATMDAVLYGSREGLAGDARRQVQQMADRYRLGAEIVGVSVQSVQPPDAVAAAFGDAQKAREDRARTRSEAQAYADDVIPQARGRAATVLHEAEGHRAKVVAEATGAAARFDQVVAQYAKAPAVMRDRMYIETMQQIFSSTSKVMIDAKSANNTIYLPLDGLLSRSTANEAARSAHSGIVVPPQDGAAQPQQPPSQATQPQPQQQQGAAAQPAQPAQPQPQQQGGAAESPRTRELRSRDTGRERESR